MLLSFYLIFCQFKPGIAYKSFTCKKACNCEQKYSPFHALFRQLVSFYKRIKVYHIRHGSGHNICFLAAMFVFTVVSEITACNINPYRISSVIFEQTKFNETDYWRNRKSVYTLQ